MRLSLGSSVTDVAREKSLPDVLSPQVARGVASQRYKHRKHKTQTVNLRHTTRGIHILSGNFACLTSK